MATHANEPVQDMLPWFEREYAERLRPHQCPWCLHWEPSAHLLENNHWPTCDKTLTSGRCLPMRKAIETLQRFIRDGEHVELGLKWAREAFANHPQKLHDELTTLGLMEVSA